MKHQTPLERERAKWWNARARQESGIPPREFIIVADPNPVNAPPLETQIEQHLVNAMQFNGHPDAAETPAFYDPRHPNLLKKVVYLLGGVFPGSLRPYAVSGALVLSLLGAAGANAGCRAGISPEEMDQLAGKIGAQTQKSSERTEALIKTSAEQTQNYVNAQIEKAKKEQEEKARQEQDKLRTGVSKLEERVGGVEKRVGGVEDSAKGLDTRVKVAEGVNRELENRVQRLTDSYAQLTAQYTQLITNYTQIKGTLEATATKASVSALEASIQTLTVNFKGLSDVYSQIKSGGDATAAKVTALEAGIAQMNRDIAQNRESLSRIYTQPVPPGFVVPPYTSPYYPYALTPVPSGPYVAQDISDVSAARWLTLSKQLVWDMYQLNPYGFQSAFPGVQIQLFNGFFQDGEAKAYDALGIDRVSQRYRVYFDNGGVSTFSNTQYDPVSFIITFLVNRPHRLPEVTVQR